MLLTFSDKETKRLLKSEAVICSTYCWAELPLVTLYMGQSPTPLQ